MTAAIALFLRPFILLLVMLVVLVPVRKAVIRWMPEGKLKRILLMKV